MTAPLGTIQMISSFDQEQLRYKLMGRHYRVKTSRGWTYTRGKRTAQLVAEREEKPRIDPIAQIKANNKRLAKIEQERIVHLIESITNGGRGQ